MSQILHLDICIRMGKPGIVLIGFVIVSIPNFKVTLIYLIMFISMDVFLVELSIRLIVCGLICQRDGFTLFGTFNNFMSQNQFI